MTLGEHLTSRGIEFEGNGEELTIRHPDDSMAVVGAAAAMVGGAAATRFKWLRGGAFGSRGAWATLKALA